MKKLSTEEFIQLARQKHKDVYLYERTTYSSSHRKVTITCKTHGDFLQTAQTHLQGRGCKQCSDTKRTSEQFAIDGSNKHNSKYTYENVIYKNLNCKVAITCPIHGDFEQTPRDHLHRQAGCPKCAHQLKMTTETFIQKANEKHKNKYSYEKTQYSTVFENVIITCPIHGDFEQIASSHLVSRGCRKCSKTFSRKEDKWLTSIGIPDTPTTRQVRLTVNNRIVFVDGFDPTTNTVYEFLGDFWHGNLKRYNEHTINKAIKITFGELYTATTQRLNEIQENGYTVVYIWESDFDSAQKQK